MVDLDSNPTKLIEIVEVGKQLLITRGALTTFSIANDVAKYFAILPAMFAYTYATEPGKRGPLNSLNVMHLGDPKSAILSRDHLQRADHPGARPARAPRRQVPRDRRDGAAAAQPLDLRPRRDDPSLHRDQADRPDRAQPARRVSCDAGPLPDPARHGRRSREDVPDAAGGPLGARGGPRRRHRLPGAARPARDRRARRGARARAAPAVRLRRARARGDGRRRGHPARARARADRRARAHEPSGGAEREALAGHRGGAGGRDRRHLDRQRPAPREPERRDRRADRGARARDVSRRGARDGRRGRARRPDARRRCRSACAPARSTPAIASTSR